MNKQIVLLAAGISSRFFPFNTETHKSLVKICGKPVIGWTLDGLKKLKANNVLVVISKKDSAMKSYLDSYKGIDLKIVYQEKALGMGDALLSVKDSLEDSFILGFPHFVNENVFKQVSEVGSGKSGVGLLVDQTEEPWKYGILTLDRGGEAIGIIEKPEKGSEPSNIRAAGCYLLTKEFIKFLEQTPLSEYQFESALDKFMKSNKVSTIKADEPVMPLKYPWDIVAIKDYILEKLPEARSTKAKISDTAVVRGKVIIEEGAKVLDFALVDGPCYIGKNAVVGSYCILRDKSVLGEGTELERYADCTRSIVGSGTHIHSGFIGDSIIGEGARIGAGFITANRRIDRDNVKVEVKSEKVSTGNSRIGVLMGDFVKTGINVSTMPGVAIGQRSIIGPMTAVMENVPEKTLLYTKQDKRTKILPDNNEK